MEKKIVVLLLLFISFVSAYAGTTVRVEAESYDLGSGVKIETNSNLSGSGNVGYIKNACWIKFNAQVFNQYNSRFDFSASGSIGGKIEIRLDAVNGTLIGTATVNPTSGWSDYRMASALISPTTGTHDVYFVFTGGTGYLFNLDYFEVFTSNPSAINFTLSTSVNSVSKGFISSNVIENEIEEGTKVILTAKPNYGFNFAKWTDQNGNFISSSNPYSFSISTDTTIIAHFNDGIILNQTASVTGGFANTEGKGIASTTGGNGGYLVVVKTLDELREYAESTPPYTIIVNGHINAEPWSQINVNSNKTIVGYGDDATLKNIELNMVEKQNIIIRNLIIRDSKVPNDTTKAFDYDAIQSDSCHHLWIDHCLLTNCNDGLIDLRLSSDYVTVSWNQLTHHNKAFGIGWTSATDYRITVHHNRIDSTTQRNPSFGNGIGHLYNNYLSNISSYGNFARGIAINVIQNSVFDKVKNPLTFDTGAKLYSSGNQFYNCSGSNSGNVSAMPFNPANYYTFTLDPTSIVIDKVDSESGPKWAVGDEYTNLLPKSTLTTSILGNGTLSPESGSYITSGLIHVKATPQAGWKFDHWSGDLNGYNADTILVLDFNKNICANFIQENSELLTSADVKDLISCHYNSISKTIQIKTDQNCQNIELSIYTIDGRAVLAGHHSNNLNFSVANLNKGIYIVSVLLNNHLITNRIVVF